ncbi:MAG: hypothetical protein M3491_07640 [Actinomycetota bacterium]|nr:hypothetical protein [Actinomycetota bacterium]
MGLRGWVRRLERASQDTQIKIIQEDGTTARFPMGTAEHAFLHEANRLRALHKGADPGEAHPLTVAKRSARFSQEFIFDADEQPRRTEGK